MKDTDFLKSILALTCWRDGHEDGTQAMRGIAFVIRNRVRAGWYGGDWTQILSHHKDWSAKLEPPSDELPDTRVYSFMSFLQQIDPIFSGAVEDDVCIKRDGDWKYVLTAAPPPALYYGRLDQISNPWFLENISRKPEQHQRIAQVGMLYFFT